ncbi:MAG: MaoC family dehydratase N-terminal domain-containing protein [Solirubrobacterales bacterium]|nr:MaoC family dehydratase N-terminal domain-containing protein [Solirubrobacterales bacterium]MCB8970920.1 MaoC family dehydratase N-terminal domain-containing protein [Thermoleophilales bacterium]MCO5326184.1 MaoC family dehydratase N-terminal domain-containing protein [Solirubrobacterales bacterium]
MSTTETSAWNVEELGRWTDEQSFAVEADRLIAYARATNDPTQAHLSGELAPPVFAIVPPFTQLGEPTMSIVPPELMMRVVHGEQDMHFHQPIRPGMELITRAAGLGIHKAPSGVTLHTRIETRTADGEPVNDQWMVAFFRGAEDDIDVGETAPAHRVDEADRSAEPVAEVAAHFDDDQTFRYSEASGDLMPIHLDEDVAKAMGLPGIIVHGLCTMAFTSWAIVGSVCDGDSSRLKRLALRFSRPGRPGQDVTTTIWGAPSTAEGLSAYAFETTADDGTVITKDGLAEVS